MSTVSRSTPLSGGRPRDLRIDDAVLRATVELLAEVGYLRLTVAAIADRAGTNKPAIYRRWPTKAHLVHDAVFPVDPRMEALPPGGDLRDDVRAMVAVGLDLLGTPAARAAIPGLMAETVGDPTMRTDVVSRFEVGRWGWLARRIERAIETGEVRDGVEPSAVLELISGAVFIATSIRPPEQLSAAWVDRIVDVIVAGIAL